VLVVYPMLIGYSRKLTPLVFKAIPAEPLHGLFLAIVVLLAYYDASLRGALGGLHSKHLIRDTLEKRCISRSALYDIGGCANIIRVDKATLELA
jgi:hypothetical protein